MYVAVIFSLCFYVVFVIVTVISFVVMSFPDTIHIPFTWYCHFVTIELSCTLLLRPKKKALTKSWEGDGISDNAGVIYYVMQKKEWIKDCSFSSDPMQDKISCSSFKHGRHEHYLWVIWTWPREQRQAEERIFTNILT
jgi:hypothetical protein